MNGPYRLYGVQVVQTGVMRPLALSTSRLSIKYLDPKVKAELVLCIVPAGKVSRYEQGYLNSEYGVLEFIAQHHPSHDVRVKVIAELMETNNAKITTSLAH